MHYGIFIGEKAKDQPVRILILGESHHVSTDPKVTTDKVAGVPATYTTASVVLEHLEKLKNEKKGMHPFLTKIAQTFGAEDEETFWRCVYFGNYIDVLCGIRDSIATNLLKITDKCEELNRQLFAFIEENEIDVVFCFSRRVYSALPQLEKQDSENEVDGADAHRLEKCIYNPGSRENVNIDLNKSVTFYGLRHTSQGFSYRKYQDRIKKVVQEHGLPF